MTRHIKTILAVLLINCSLTVGQAQNSTLEQGFKNLPPSGKARTMWFWINGNVSKTGITADLEAMKEIGLQGALIFNVSLQHPSGTASYLSPEWLDLFHFAALEAQRLGLELSFHNGAGWSSTGGPSITPEYAMQEVVYAELTVQGGIVFKGQLPQPSTNLGYYEDIAVLAFPKPKSDERITNLDYKTLSGKVRNHLAPDDKEVASSAIVKKTDIINVTSKITGAGLLEWEVPQGEWVLLRVGHTATGSKNRFPSDGGAGLECDKMSSEAVDLFWEDGIMPIINKLDTLIGSVVANCHVDSYEVGTTNWTANFADEFKRLRSYDCGLYLPALAGYYIESGEETERFLWDFRRTIGDLIATNYYGRFRERCHQYGMLFSTEPYWGPFDNMQVGANADAVLSEFWSGHLASFDSPKFVASIAKLNGSAIAEAEAFTDEGGWQRDPGSLKAIGDLAWAQGINRFVIHCYAHQPWNVAPGLTLDRFGIDFNRHNTWWKQGKPFLDYINRGQFLLQQGTTVADVLVFTGEASPNDALLIPQIKALGYDYDLVGSNKIASLSVKEGLIYTEHGATYKALVLPQNSWTTPETLSKLETLAKGGATILGAKPEKSPSLQHYPNSDIKVAQLADGLWGEGLIKDIAVLDFLKNGALHPDVSIEQLDGNDFDFTHRKAADTDIYFVVNKQKESRVLNCRFRVSGMQPELWNAESGEIIQAVVWQDNGDGT
ncbi:MAG: glycosyl hydrolase, partial [Flavobacteriaceae bacterium]